jgi:hypothetical protein
MDIEQTESITTKFDLIREKLEHAKRETILSLNWYAFTVMTVAERTRLPIDGDWVARRWWFVLTPTDKPSESAIA